MRTARLDLTFPLFWSASKECRPTTSVREKIVEPKPGLGTRQTAWQRFAGPQGDGLFARQFLSARGTLRTRWRGSPHGSRPRETAPEEPGPEHGERTAIERTVETPALGRKRASWELRRKGVAVSSLRGRAVWPRNDDTETTKAPVAGDGLRERHALGLPSSPSIRARGGRPLQFRHPRWNAADRESCPTPRKTPLRSSCGCWPAADPRSGRTLLHKQVAHRCRYLYFSSRCNLPGGPDRRSGGGAHPKIIPPCKSPPNAPHHQLGYP